MFDQREADPRLAGVSTPRGIRVEIAAQEPTVVDPERLAFAADGALYVLRSKPTRNAESCTIATATASTDEATVVMSDLEKSRALSIARRLDLLHQRRQRPAAQAFRCRSAGTVASRRRSQDRPACNRQRGRQVDRAAPRQRPVRRVAVGGRGLDARHRRLALRHCRQRRSPPPKSGRLAGHAPAHGRRLQDASRWLAGA